MRVILFGSNGMLGSYIKKHLNDGYDLISLTRKEIDISKSSQFDIIEYLKSINITENDIIINSAGVIKQREYNILDMILVNSVFPHILSTVKNKFNCKVIHITTDCVFSGLDGGYTESSNHDCLDDYGKSKSLCEPKDLTIIRTSIIGEENNNKKSLIEWVKSNKESRINGYNNHLWNGVTCLELSKVIKNIIDNNLYWNGVRHIFSPNTVSKYELVSFINDIYKLGNQVDKLDTIVNCFRNLSSEYKMSYVNNTIYDQIKEQKEYKI